MKSRTRGLFAIAGILGMCCFTLTLSADPPASTKKKKEPELKGKLAAIEKQQDDKRVSVEQARDRAKLMHNVYLATLDVIHHHYFRADRPVLPARAMEDVFAEVDRSSNLKAKWIAVNTPAMSVSHEPQTEFEKKAAEELAAGKNEYELVENGNYQRASQVPLGVGCVGCHTRLTTTPIKSPRFAGLIISIPVKEK